MWSTGDPTKIYCRSTGYYMVTLDGFYNPSGAPDDRANLELAVKSFSSGDVVLQSTGNFDTDFTSLNANELEVTYYSGSVSGMFYMEEGSYWKAYLNFQAASWWQARLKVWQISKAEA